MLFPIALTAAAALALINLWLGFRCGRVRISEKISIGDGGSDLLRTRMRAQSNFSEYVPITLILMALVEAGAGVDAYPWLYILAALFILARLAHPLGMERPAPNPLRSGGMLVTILVTLALAVWGLVMVFIG